MNRWEAIVEIVKSFNANGKSGLAFIVITLFLLIPPIFFVFAATGDVGDYLRALVE